MNTTGHLSFILALTLTLSACQPQQAPETSAEPVADTAHRAARWQLAHMNDFSYVRTYQHHTEFERGWIQAAFYIGLTRWAQTTGEEDYWRTLERKSEDRQWRLGPLEWHADDQAIAQVYAALAERSGDLSRLAPARAEFRGILENPPTHSLEFNLGGDSESTCQRRWCWCDALFMAPPGWAAVSRLTGDPAYMDYAHREFQAIVDYLYDTEEHLFYRDSRFFDQRTAQGHKVFWSRGNGWVFAGLPLLLEQLADDDPRRAYYEALFLQMARSLRNLQLDSGFWPSSLLDPGEYPIPESSGTGFMTFGLAWGINQGLLPRDEYLPAALAGWRALQGAVDDEGRLGWVQQVGYAPDQVREDDTQLYGVGALLLAASEMVQLSP